MGTYDVVRRRYTSVLVVPVHTDETFQTKYKAMCKSTDKTMLYRGFSIELSPPPYG